VSLKTAKALGLTVPDTPPSLCVVIRRAILTP
jgi:hypothetical protein